MGVARWHWAAGACLATALGLSQGQASARQSQNREWCVNENESYSADLQIKGCTAVIDSGRESGKNLAAAFYNRGLTYWKKGDLDRPIADFNAATFLDPKNTTAYYLRGLAYWKKGDLDLAIVNYNEALRLDPKYVSAYNNRGSAYYAKGDPYRAIADYDEAIRLDPKDAKAFYNRGNAYDDKGDLDRAIADYDAAIELDPKDAKAFYNRGLAYRKKGDHDRAIADYNEAIRLNPKLGSTPRSKPQAGNVAPDGVLPPDNVFAMAELERDGTVNISYRDPGPGHHEITLRYPPAHPKYKEVKDACVESGFLQPFLCILLNKH